MPNLCFLIKFALGTAAGGGVRPWCYISDRNRFVVSARVCPSLTWAHCGWKRGEKGRKREKRGEKGRKREK